MCPIRQHTLTRRTYRRVSDSADDIPWADLGGAIDDEDTTMSDHEHGSGPPRPKSVSGPACYSDPAGGTGVRYRDGARRTEHRPSEVVESVALGAAIALASGPCDEAGGGDGRTPRPPHTGRRS
jgi:hypothetical protein